MPQIVESYSIDYSCLHANSWLVSSNFDKNLLFSSQSDILESGYDLKDHWNITHSGIVKYDHHIRPNEYQQYHISESQQLISFGDDLGLKGCHGYWPNNEECPLVQEYHTQYSLQPSIELNLHGGCYQNLKTIGQFVNGANIYSFLEPTDLLDRENILWNKLRTTVKSEKETITDLCNGFVENGRYGHATYSSCLSERLQENGQSHSKIYGWSLDNYPIYGPYQARGVLAKSSWRPRDYSSVDSDTGCKSSSSSSSSLSLRSCLLKDPLHPEDGIIELDSKQSGPSLEEIPLGAFFEDYYYDSLFHQMGNDKSPDQEYLDEHNGHDHEPYGYHYHITTTDKSDGDHDQDLQPVFPFILGPKFYGCLPSDLNTFCCQSIEESVSQICPFTSPAEPSSSSTASLQKRSSCGVSSQATLHSQCYVPSSPLPETSTSHHRHLDEGTTAAPTIFTPSYSLTPTVTPTAFQSPTFKPTISFISHSPTSITSFPTFTPSSPKQSAGHGGTSHVFTSQDIALIVLIVFGGLVVLGSAGVLFYWHYYTRTGPSSSSSSSSYSHPSASSPSYADKIKDLTGISLVEKI
jgi:hypothetical protein